MKQECVDKDPMSKDISDDPREATVCANQFERGYEYISKWIRSIILQREWLL